MEARGEAIGTLLRSVERLRRHIHETPTHALLISGGDMSAFTIREIEQFRPTEARDLLLRQLARRSDGEIVVACYEEGDFASSLLTPADWRSLVPEEP